MSEVRISHIRIYDNKVTTFFVETRQVPPLGNILFVPGWGTKTEEAPPLLFSLAELGYKSVAVDIPGIHTRRRDTSTTLDHKAHALLDIIGKTSVDNLSIVAHSQGALVASIATLEYLQSLKPNQESQIKNLILIAPAGSLGKENPFALTGRFSQHVVKSFVEDEASRRHMQKRKKLSSLPHVLAREVIDIANTSIWEILDQIKSYGVNVGILVGAHDSLFPSQAIQHLAKQHDILCEEISMYHNGPDTRPELVAGKVKEMIQKLEEAPTES